MNKIYKKQHVLTIGKLNKHNRIYTQNSVDVILEQTKKLIENDILFGELNHPERLNVLLTNISHKITKIYQEEVDLFVDIELLDTPKGLEAQSILNKSDFKIELMGLGNINSDLTVDLAEIITFNIIPSTPEENKEQAKNSLIELYESQIMDLTMMSKIELGDDVIAEIKRLKEIIND